jgi:biopolymer transport protein ExbD
MAMSLGTGGPQKAQIKVTPMIDVLLVLIIIFMVITPHLTFREVADVLDIAKGAGVRRIGLMTR